MTFCNLAHKVFAEALVAKGEYRSILEQLPIKLITHPEPGLYGAAAAFAARFAK